jgi:hypothetical protein
MMKAATKRKKVCMPGLTTNRSLAIVKNPLTDELKDTRGFRSGLRIPPTYSDWQKNTTGAGESERFFFPVGGNCAGAFTPFGCKVNGFVVPVLAEV